MYQQFRKAEVIVDEQERNACLCTVILLREDIQRISTPLTYQIFPSLSCSQFFIQDLISVLRVKSGILSFCVKKKRDLICHFSICCLCHILLLPLLIFSSFTSAVTSLIQCRVLLVTYCFVFSIPALVLLRGKCLSSAALCYLPQ